MHDTSSFTGIPIDALWAVLVGLVSVIYWDLKREVRLNRKESLKRGKEFITFRIYLKMLCKKSGIDYVNGGPHEDDTE